MMGMMAKAHSKKMSGFNLLELMIVVMIIGIIAAFGYSVYTEKVIETRRTDAKEALGRLATLQEKIFTECNQYATALTTFAAGSNCGGGVGGPVIAWNNAGPFLSEEGHYVISIIAPPPIGPTGTCTAAICFMLQADPVGAGASGMQTRNAVSDGVLVIDHAGRKSWAHYKLSVGLDPNTTGMYIDSAGRIIKWSAK